ncbi:MAG: hypothetical protein HXS46_13830 [Theionarchaea archaeon]|nr:hypothetical protein [Theionarchaea archaeon]
MEVRKNVALDHKHIKMLQPLIRKHQGNFSAAIRELVELMDLLSRNFGSIDTLKESTLIKKSKRDEYIENHYGVVVPSQILHWLLSGFQDDMPPKQYLLFSLYSYLREQAELDAPIEENPAAWEKLLNDFYHDLGWPIDIRIRSSNRTITVEVIGFDAQINKLAFLINAMNLACGSVNYRITEMENIQTAIFAAFEPCENEEEASESIRQFLKSES